MLHRFPLVAGSGGLAELRWSAGDYVGRLPRVSAATAVVDGEIISAAVNLGARNRNIAERY
jgi:hypothetical protein